MKMKNGASRDLFDLGSSSQAGERQVDLEELIQEKSLFQAIKEKDAAAEADIMARAKAGQIIRLI